MNSKPDVRLKDVCELIVDCPHSTAKDEGEGYPLIRTPNIGPGYLDIRSVHRVSLDVYRKRNVRATPKPGDIILAREAPAGNAGIVLEGQEVCLGQRTVLIRPNKSVAEPLFMNYFLNAPQQRQSLLNSANGATVSHINMSSIRTLPVSLPDIGVQQRVASVLGSLDALIRNNQRTNDYLAELCEALATRETATEGTLADICSQVATKVSYEVADTSTYVSTESLFANKGGRQAASSLPTTGKVTAYVAGDTLVSNIRPYFKKIWYADCDGTCSGDVIVFRATDPLLAPYVYACLRQDAFFDFIMAGSKGTKMPRGDKKQMMTFPISPYCGDDDLTAITSAVRQIGANNRENANLSELRDAILPKLMSGEIDVSQVVITQPNNHL